MARYSKDVKNLKNFKVKVNDGRPYGVRVYLPAPLFEWLGEPSEITFKKKNNQIVIDKQ